MKELVLTHVGKGQVDGVKNAVIALVDYDAYKVSVKKIPVTKGFLETGELSELIKAGKLRVYRDMLESSYDAWLAIDPARGCLAVDKDGNVVTMSTYEYLYRLGRWPSSYEPSGADAYSPYRYGQAGESFYAVVKEIERKHNASLKSEAVRKDILDQTGVFIKYTVYKESMPEEESGTYVVTLFGRTVDRLDVVCEGGSVCVNVQGGIIEEVWGDCDGCIRIVSGANGNVRRVKVSQRVKRLEFNMSVPEGDVYPEIITDAKTCELASIDGYHRADADLSMFQHLKEFSNCWQMSSYSREGDVYSLRLQLPGVSNTEFDECFYNVDIKELYPYMQADGVLDITGLAHVKKSFHNFRGPTFIRGIVAGVIDGSFITNDFNGQFDVTAGYVDNSFGYISEKVRRSGYGGVFSHAVGIKANYHPEGVIHINLHDDVLRDCISDVRDKRLIFGSTEIRLRDARYDCTLTYWKQVQNINYAGDSLDIPVVLDLNETVTFNVFANMQFCRIVSSFWSDKSVISPNLKGLVTQLDAGDYPYSNVLHYGDRCFASRRFKNMFLCVLPEGLQSIGERAFFQTKGVDYLVIPKSCQHIGAAAFVEMKSSTDDLTVICVYRDSYAHKWSKGKKYNIKVIDSLEDIPQQASKESEYDYLAAFVDTPDWAVNSKPVVAKILTMFPVDVVERIPVVATLTAELSHYFAEKQNDLVQASKEREAEDTGNSFTVAAGTDKPCKAGYISRAALQAAALNALYGACPELLTVDILDKFAWRFTQIHEVVKWVGTPKVTSDNSVAHEITVYLRGNEVLYVGCGFIRDRGIKQGLSVDASVSWEVPQKVLSSEILLGPDLEGQLVVYSVWGEAPARIQVHREWLQGDAAAKMSKFLYDSMVFVRVIGEVSSGNVIVTTSVVYDVINNKLYQFKSSRTKSRYERSTREINLGTYRGEMSIDEYRELWGVASYEKACLAAGTLQLPVVEPASPSFELEFCRTHPKFNLLGSTPRVQLLIELLSQSGLVKQVTRSVMLKKAYQNRLLPQTLADGTLIEVGKSTGYGYFMGITYQNKFYGFEAGFDMWRFAQLTDEIVVRKAPYSNPEGGYLTVVWLSDLFAVTPCCYEGSADDSYGAYRRGIFVALDFTSGKLVLAYDENIYSLRSHVICSFNSAKDARDFYTAFDCKFLGLPTEAFSRKFRDVIDASSDNSGRLGLDSCGDKRIVNSLAYIGGLGTVESVAGESPLYNEAILKYCRK